MTHQRVLVKCGGFATQLSRHVNERIDGDPLWSARFDANDPAAVVATHLDFLEHGAQIILSNTYQASVEGFAKYMQLSQLESVQLMRKSVELAQQAKAQYLQRNPTKVEPDLPLILASIGPYGAHLHDCSEYSGSYADHITVSELQAWHRTRIDACLAQGVDGLALETIPCQLEAEALVDMLLQDYAGVKFWVSFTCQNETSLPHGERFADAVEAIWTRVRQRNASEQLIGIGVNCVHPQFVTPLFQSVHSKLRATATPLPPLVVYSNRGETYDAQLHDWRAPEHCRPLASYMPEWLALGVRVIGGCCRVYAEDISQIRQRLDDLTVQHTQRGDGAA